MVGGGRHHTPLPSEDVRRGRSTHTLHPFWPGYKHTLPSKTVESCLGHRDNLESWGLAKITWGGEMRKRDV